MAEHASLVDAYTQARRRGALLDLSDRAKWHLSGADRVRYLNGQVTNDIRRTRSDAALTACVTTAKGRLSGVIFVSAAPSFLHIDAEAELREPLAARLERYIIADDATLEDATEDECLFHILPASAPGKTNANQEIGAPGDTKINQKIGAPGAEIRSATRFSRPGFDVIAPRSEHPRLLALLAAEHLLIPAPLAESLRIEAGIPRWGAELTEETLPPEAGLDQTAIDYHKGCYIGQEVISRIKSVGHVNRRLAGFTAAAALAPGMTLHPPDEPGKTAGEITSAAWSFGLETWAALGYLKRGFAQTSLLARSPDGATVAVEIRDLPLLP
jgi:folate-binding protein YgfZ